jgi:hypothetical protein
MSKDMLDEARVQEIKDRLADRYTAAEIADLLDLPVEELIEEFWDRITRSKVLMEEVGASEEDEDDADIS